MKRSLWGVGLLSALVLSCGQSGSDASNAGSNGRSNGCGGPSPEERAQNQLVFDGLKTTCEGCHTSGSRPYFASITSFESLVAYEPKLVTPGDPDKSAFVQILEGNGTGAFKQMPPAGQPYAQMTGTTLTMAQVRDWVSKLRQHAADTRPSLTAPRVSRLEHRTG